MAKPPLRGPRRTAPTRLEDNALARAMLRLYRAQVPIMAPDDEYDCLFLRALEDLIRRG